MEKEESKQIETLFSFRKKCRFINADVLSFSPNWDSSFELCVSKEKNIFAYGMNYSVLCYKIDTLKTEFFVTLGSKKDKGRVLSLAFLSNLLVVGLQNKKIISIDLNDVNIQKIYAIQLSPCFLLADKNKNMIFIVDKQGLINIYVLKDDTNIFLLFSKHQLIISPSTVQIINQGLILIGTNFGTLYLYNFIDRSSTFLKEENSSPILSTCFVMKGKEYLIGYMNSQQQIGIYTLLLNDETFEAHIKSNYLIEFSFPFKKDKHCKDPISHQIELWSIGSEIFLSFSMINRKIYIMNLNNILILNENKNKNITLKKDQFNELVQNIHFSYIYSTKKISDFEWMCLSFDGSISFWDIEKELLTQTFHTFRHQVKSLCFSKTNENSLYIGFDKEMFVWNIPRTQDDQYGGIIRLFNCLEGEIIKIKSSPINEGVILFQCKVNNKENKKFGKESVVLYDTYSEKILGSFYCDVNILFFGWIKINISEYKIIIIHSYNLMKICCSSTLKIEKNCKLLKPKKDQVILKYEIINIFDFQIINKQDFILVLILIKVYMNGSLGISFFINDLDIQYKENIINNFEKFIFIDSCFSDKGLFLLTCESNLKIFDYNQIICKIVKLIDSNDSIKLKNILLSDLVNDLFNEIVEYKTIEKPHGKIVTSCIWIKDKLFATGSEDKTIQIWNFENSDPYYINLRGHKGYVRKISSIYDKIISFSDDGIIRLWNINNLIQNKEEIVNYRPPKEKNRLSKYHSIFIKISAKLLYQESKNDCEKTISRLVNPIKFPIERNTVLDDMDYLIYRICGESKELKNEKYEILKLIIEAEIEGLTSISKFDQLERSLVLNSLLKKIDLMMNIENKLDLVEILKVNYNFIGNKSNDTDLQYIIYLLLINNSKCADLSHDPVFSNHRTFYMLVFRSILMDNLAQEIIDELFANIFIIDILILGLIFDMKDLIIKGLLLQDEKFSTTKNEISKKAKVIIQMIENNNSTDSNK